MPSSEHFLYIAGGLALLALLVIVAGRLRVGYWRKHGLKLEMDKDYISPPTTLLRRIVRCAAGKISQFLYLGPMKKYGKLPSTDFDGLDIYYANHQNEHDALVSMRVLGRRRARFFIAFNQCRGVRAPLVSFAGGIPVDFYDEVGKKAPAKNGSQPLDRPIAPRRLLASVQAAIARLIAELGTCFWIFPQGRLVEDNKLTRDDFHEGLLRIAREFKKATGRDVRFIPVAIAYDRSLARRTWLHWFLNSIGYRSFRTFMDKMTSRFAVSIGEPILESTLPADRKAATTVLFDKLVTMCGELDAKVNPVVAVAA
jgi:1-acyl-sn-glycerol-3-phosphate acyltransferase